MPPKEKFSIEGIKELADNIRVINGFVENNGFDGSLLSVNFSSHNTIKKIDWALVCFCAFFGICVSLLLLKAFYDVTGNSYNALLIVCLVSALVAGICMHLRFNNTLLTLIFGVGIVAIIAIGFGVLTPKEVMETAETRLVK